MVTSQGEEGTSECSNRQHKKAHRGENQDKTYKHPPPGEKFLVEWNHTKQPVGKTGKYFETKLSLLARRNELFPMDKSWLEQSPNKMTDAMAEIEVC